MISTVFIVEVPLMIISKIASSLHRQLANGRGDYLVQSLESVLPPSSFWDSLGEQPTLAEVDNKAR